MRLRTGLLLATTAATTAALVTSSLLTVASAAGAAGSPEFVGITPQRVLDTRAGAGNVTFDHEYEHTGPIGGSDVARFRVAGRGIVPPDVMAVALNVTAVDPAAAGHLTVWPCSAQIPTASNLNYGPGQTVANAVVTGTDFEGNVCVYSKAATDVVVDVSGYMPVGSSYAPLVPVRVEDTRVYADWQFFPELGYSFPFYPADDDTPDDPTDDAPSPFLDNRLEVPSDAEAVVLNVTATQTTGPGHVSIRSCDAVDADASTLNYSASGATVPNLAVAPVVYGAVCFDLKETGHLVVDAAGYFPAGSGYNPRNPERVLDTRGGAAVTDASVTAAMPAGATAAVLNITVTQTAGAGYVTAYPCGTPAPTASNVNFGGPGQTIANAAIVGVGDGGDVCFKVKGSAHLIVDVAGWFG
jgi:hypothetical protein